MAEYPLHLVRRRTLADGRKMTVRPIRVDDERAEAKFFDHLSAQSRQQRLPNAVDAPSDKPLHFFSHIDYERRMAFVCEAETGTLVGEARYVANADGRSCEFGVVVADDWQRSGIAALLMDALIRAAQARGLETMEGLVLRDNGAMLRCAKSLGFDAGAEPLQPAMVRVTRKL